MAGSEETRLYKFPKDSHEYEAFKDYYNIIQAFWHPQNTEEWWEKLLEIASDFDEKHNETFWQQMMAIFLSEQSRKCRELSELNRLLADDSP